MQNLPRNGINNHIYKAMTFLSPLVCLSYDMSGQLHLKAGHATYENQHDPPNSLNNNTNDHMKWVHK